ncbi:MAG: phosphoribosylglycinamide formyltransferase [Leptolyngbya sp. PLA1]|nr:phosphoribosylglycinamide formyltransferase [Leptolyngbya sp. PLA1]
MVSGSGRTLENILARCDSGDIPARVALVIASQECRGAEIARGRVPAVLVMPGEIPAPTLLDVLRGHDIDLVILAGYLRLVRIPDAFRGRVLNIHPALLPLHGGTGMHGRRVHEAVLASGDRQSGCTVHFCDDTYDTGKIILQHACPVQPDDTPDTLAARVFQAELQAYPRAIRWALGNLPARSSV